MTPGTGLFIFANYLLLLCIVILANASEDLEEQKLIAELQLDDLEFTDAWDNVTYYKRMALITKNFQDKTDAEKQYGFILRSHAEILKKFSESDVPTELERNYTYQVKPGDGLLPQEEWNKIVLFKNKVEEISTQVKQLCQNKSEDCVISNNFYLSTMKNSRDLEELNTTWTTRMKIFNNSIVKQFLDSLLTVKEAATLNEQETVQTYWEYLTDYPEGYSHALKFWEEVLPFYKKFHRFVKGRLHRYYNVSEDNYNNEILIYLLGGQLGTDWSSIADVVLPHPQLHYDVESYLKYKDVKDIYSYSENILQTLGLGALGTKFWINSHFNASKCGPEIFEYSDQKYTEIWECNVSSWTSYLDAHAYSLKVAINNLEYSSLPRNSLRYSALDDAIEILGSLLAIESLSYHRIVDSETFQNEAEDDPVKMTKLLLTALRILPKLSYYLMVDQWRLDVVQNNKNLTESWWNYRKEYQMIGSNTSEDPEFLEDKQILSNKPYLSKFLGTLIAFQIFNQYKERLEDSSRNIVEEIGQDESFTAMIKERHTTDWPYLLSLNYGLDVTATDILKYFEPLEQYFDSAPIEQVPIVSTTSTTSIPSTTASITIKPISVLNEAESEVANDEPNSNKTRKSTENISRAGNIGDDHLAMHIGIGLTIGVAFLLAVVIIYKRFRKKKRRPNNRRFDA